MSKELFESNNIMIVMNYLRKIQMQPRHWQNLLLENRNDSYLLQFPMMMMRRRMRMIDDDTYVKVLTK